MPIEERDRLAVRDASVPFGKFTQAGIRKQRGGAPRWYKHTELLVRKLIQRQYAVRVEKGLYELTDAGLAWCRADNVANTP